MASGREIFVVPAFGQGHLLPSMELCKQLLSRNYQTTLVIFSNLSSSVPSSLLHLPLFKIAKISSPPPPPPGSPPMAHMRSDQTQMAAGIESLLLTRPGNPDSHWPVCAVVDVLLMMSWTSHVFEKYNVPTVGFFTSGACSAAMEYATWKACSEDIQPGETRVIPGLPEDMGLTCWDLKRRSGPGGPRKMGPPNPGERPHWVDDTDRSIALMINTCDDIERPFIEYVARELSKPVWGVGPLLPEKYWESAGSLLRDRDIRSNRESNITEDEVIEWLGSKPRGSVLYVSFGSELGPTMEEYPQLANALEESTRSFIWVIQPGSGRTGPPRANAGGSNSSDEGYFPHGLDKEVGRRGMIIHGWAPQLLILSHESTGGFLSHCGWNSTVEAIGRGVPFLAWPIRGDQYYDAKLIVSHLKVGYMVSDDMSSTVTKDDIARGIEGLMGDEEIKKRASALGSKFHNGFPESSKAALDAFRDFINQRVA